MHAPSTKQARMTMKVIITVVKHVFHTKNIFAILAKKLIMPTISVNTMPKMVETVVTSVVKKEMRVV